MSLFTYLEEYDDPTRYKLIIKSNDETETKYTFDSFHTSNAPFDLTDISADMNVGQTGNFGFVIDDTKDRVIKDTIECGAVAIIQAGKKESEYKNIAYGIIDDIDDNYPATNRILYTFRGLGFGVILNYTILNFLKSANKESITGTQSILKNPEFRVDNLAEELFESEDILPIKNSKTLQQRGNFDTTSLEEAIQVTIPSVNRPQSTASTIIEDFASSSGNVFFVDPQKAVQFRPPYTVHSGITIRPWDKTRLTDPMDTTSYYYGGWSSRRMMKLDQGFFNRVFLTINTDDIINTAPGTETPNFTSLVNKDVAVQFRPGSAQLFNIALLLSKTGTGRSSVEDSLNLTGVKGLICKDDGNNQPGSTIVAKFTIPYGIIGNSPTVVYKLDLQYQTTNIDPTSLYWIILFKCGTTEDSTIQWYHDNDIETETTDASPRYSATKQPFTPQPNQETSNFDDGWGTNSKGPVYRYTFFVTNRTTIEKSDPVSIRKYTPGRPIETRINAPWIHDVRTGYQYADILLQYGAKLKRVYEKKALSIPNKLFFPLQLCNIVYPLAGIEQNSNIMAEINGVRYSASAHDQEKPFGSYTCEVTAIGYVNHYQHLIGESMLCTE